MADSKITALGSIGTGTDPANDQLVIVDVSDVLPTGMATTGTTKRVGLNQLLSSSPTATGAFSVTGLVTAGSATITGDLTVDTNVLKVDTTLNRVGIGTASPATILDIQSAGGVFARIQNTTSTADAYLLVKNTTGEGFFGINATGPYVYTAQSLPITFTTATSERYRIASDGVATWSNVGGVAGTAMTLNSTGLGVGGSPSRKLSIVGSGATYANINSGDSTSLVGILLGGTTTPSAGQLIYDNTANSLALFTSGSSRLLIDTSGNVGIGVSAFGTSAAKVLGLANATAPSTSPAGMGQLYVESGALKFRGSSGTITTIAAA